MFNSIINYELQFRSYKLLTHPKIFTVKENKGDEGNFHAPYPSSVSFGDLKIYIKKGKN
jgi:hypothetical protein